MGPWWDIWNPFNEGRGLKYFSLSLACFLSFLLLLLFFPSFFPSLSFFFLLFFFSGPRVRGASAPKAPALDTPLNNDTYQRETLSERPIWQPLRRMASAHFTDDYFVNGPYADHILIPQGSTGSSIFFWYQMKAHIFLISNPKFQLQILCSFGDTTKSVKLKAYSQISSRGRSQKFQNLNFFTSVYNSSLKNTFPQRNWAEIISGWNKSNFPINSRVREFI